MTVTWEDPNETWQSYLPWDYTVAPDPQVSVWDRVAGVWALVGTLGYTDLTFAPRWGDHGDWSVTVPAGTQAAKVKPGRLCLTAFRDMSYTWTVDPLDTGQDDDTAVQVTARGFEALALLGAATAWPDPTIGLVSADGLTGLQPAKGAQITGPAETVITTLVATNVRDRMGLDVVCPVSQGRGGTVQCKPKGDNLLELVLRLAARGNIGVGLQLVPSTSATRAELTLVFTAPRDRTVRVHLSAADGSMPSWSRSQTGPSATRAIVVGAGQYVRDVTDTRSIADADAWHLGGQRLHREKWVAGPETFDAAPLDEAGADELDAARATDSLTMTAQEPAGTLAFRDFVPGDLVTAKPVPGLAIASTITSVAVTHTAGEAPLVVPTFGDPDADEPEALTAQQQRKLARAVARQTITRRAGQ